MGTIVVTVLTDEALTTSTPTSADKLDSGRLTKLPTAAPMKDAFAERYDGSVRDTLMYPVPASCGDGYGDGSS